MKYHTLFLGKMSQNLSSAAVVIGTLWVNLSSCMLSDNLLPKPEICLTKNCIKTGKSFEQYCALEVGAVFDMVNCCCTQEDAIRTGTCFRPNSQNIKKLIN